jgi:hypothetical protein
MPLWRSSLLTGRFCLGGCYLFLVNNFISSCCRVLLWRVLQGAQGMMCLSLAPRAVACAASVAAVQAAAVTAAAIKVATTCASARLWSGPSHCALWRSGEELGRRAATALSGGGSAAGRGRGGAGLLASAPSEIAIMVREDARLGVPRYTVLLRGLDFFGQFPVRFAGPLPGVWLSVRGGVWHTRCRCRRCCYCYCYCCYCARKKSSKETSSANNRFCRRCCCCCCHRRPRRRSRVVVRPGATRPCRACCVSWRCSCCRCCCQPIHICGVGRACPTRSSSSCRSGAASSVLLGAGALSKAEQRGLHVASVRHVLLHHQPL